MNAPETFRSTKILCALLVVGTFLAVARDYYLMGRMQELFGRLGGAS